MINNLLRKYASWVLGVIYYYLDRSYHTYNFQEKRKFMGCTQISLNKDENECPLCKNPYDSLRILKTKLPCRHTICIQCKIRLENKNGAICPLDSICFRKIIKFPAKFHSSTILPHIFLFFKLLV